MTLYIFNPEHDLALASNLRNFTPPHAARALRTEMGYLPALWAEPGDKVLVADRDYSAKALKKFQGRMKRAGLQFSLQVEFVTMSDLPTLPITDVHPWGWDPSVCHTLIRHGVSQHLMPNLDQIDVIRMLSHRSTSARLLAQLQTYGTTGWATSINRMEQLDTILLTHPQLVIKAPWSSSGRGVRFINGTINLQTSGWIKNIVKNQGNLMVEPYYNKVKDFGMEFFSWGDGRIDFCGLSLFKTVNGEYNGNILATEHWKTEKLSRYISVELLNIVKSKVCAVLGPLFNGKYKGCFGLDMMIVKNDVHSSGGFLLHPCVEINLRRTMGHAALCLSPVDDDIRRTMRIANYELRITKD